MRKAEPGKPHLSKIIRRRRAIKKRRGQVRAWLNPNRSVASDALLFMGSFGERRARAKRLNKLARLEELRAKWVEWGGLTHAEMEAVWRGVDALIDCGSSLLGRIRDERAKLRAGEGAG